MTSCGVQGIDLRTATPQRLTPELAGSAHFLITMGCGDECPFVPGVERDDWPLDDPKDKPIDEVRRIRDEIRQRVEHWSQPSVSHELAVR